MSATPRLVALMVTVAFVVGVLLGQVMFGERVGDCAEYDPADEWSKSRHDAVSVSLDDVNECSGPNVLDNINQFVMFAGYPRSGHTLVATMLSAHPNVVLADEFNVLTADESLFSSSPIALFRALIAWDLKVWSQPEHDNATYYNYWLQGLWQGKFSCLTTIGDKKGSSVPLELSRDPDKVHSRIKWIREQVGKLKVLHVMRNPFDCIATQAWRHLGYKGTHFAEFNATVNLQEDKVANDEVRKRFERFREEHESIDTFLRTQPEGDVLNIYDPELLAHPQQQVRAWCTFLDLHCPPIFLEKVTAKVMNSPFHSRDRFIWADDLVADIAAWMDTQPLLRGRFSFKQR